MKTILVWSWNEILTIKIDNLFPCCPQCNFGMQTQVIDDYIKIYYPLNLENYLKAKSELSDYCSKLYDLKSKKD